MEPSVLLRYTEKTLRCSCHDRGKKVIFCDSWLPSIDQAIRI